MQQQNSFVRWIEQVERELLAMRGVVLEEVIQFIPPMSLIHLWKLGEKAERVVDLIATRTLFYTPPESHCR